MAWSKFDLSNKACLLRPFYWGGVRNLTKKKAQGQIKSLVLSGVVVLLSKVPGSKICCCYFDCMRHCVPFQNINPIDISRMYRYILENVIHMFQVNVFKLLITFDIFACQIWKAVYLCYLKTPKEECSMSPTGEYKIPSDFLQLSCA